MKVEYNSYIYSIIFDILKCLIHIYCIHINSCQKLYFRATLLFFN